MRQAESLSVLSAQVYRFCREFAPSPSWVLYALLAVACAPAPRAAKRASAGPSRDQVVLRQPVLERFESDKLRYRARLKDGLLFRHSGRLEGSSVVFNVLNSNHQDKRSGESAVQMVGRLMVAHLQAAQVQVMGSVQVTDREGRVLRTEELRYDAAKDWIETPGRVILSGANYRLTGSRLFGHPAGGRLDIDGPVALRFDGQRMP